MSLDDDRVRREALALAERLAKTEGLREARRLQAEGRLAEILPRREEDPPSKVAGPSIQG